jgi:hypothetical protein
VTLILQHLSEEQARFIALLAKTARAQRDSLLGNVRDGRLATAPGPGKGDHNPTADLGFEPVTAETPQAGGLLEAITSLSEMARQELYALMRVGQGDLAARAWRKGMSDAAALGTDVIAAAVADDPDLHDHLMKALYETRRG